MRRFDSYTSAVLGHGMPGNGQSGLNFPALDRTARFRLGGMGYLDSDLTALYEASGVASRIVDMPADDALARGFDVAGDVDNAIGDELDRLRVVEHLTQGLRWSRLYGGAALVAVTEGGGSLEQPLNPKALPRIAELRVFDVTDFSVPAGGRYRDPTLANYGQPEFYELLSADGSARFTIHASRLITISGDALPNKVVRDRYSAVPFRGRCALSGCYESVQRYEAAMKWAERMLERKQQAVYRMEGLADMLGSDAGEAQIGQRIDHVDMSRSILNTVVIDGGLAGVGGDTYEMRDLSLAQVADVITKCETSVCADSGFPATVLFGTSPSGLNSTGDNDTAGYFRIVDHIRRNDARPPLERIISLILAQTQFQGTRPDQWELNFHPLWLPSEKEQAAAALARAQAKQAEAAAADTLMTAGAISNSEVRKDLQARGLYGLEAEIDTSSAAADFAATS